MKTYKTTKINMRSILYITLFIFVVSLSFLISSIIKNIPTPQQNSSQISEENPIEQIAQHSFIPNEIADDIHHLTPNTNNATFFNTNSAHSQAYNNLSQLFDAQNLNSSLIPQHKVNTQNKLNTQNLRQYQNIQDTTQSLDMFSFNALDNSNPIETLSQLIYEIYSPQNDILEKNKLDLTQTKEQEKIFHLLHIAQDINQALTKTLHDITIKQKDILFLESAIRVDTNLMPYPFLVIELYNKENTPYFKDKQSRSTFIKALEKNIAATRHNTDFEHTKKTRVHIIDEENFLYITYENIISHVIRLEKRKDQEQKRHTLNKNTMYCTLVIDDFGENFTLAREFMNLPFPIIFSIWPQSTHSTKIATIAHEKGLPIFLHQPMQPRPVNNYVPDMGNAGLTIDMTQEEIKAILQHNILSVPHLRGINNHMGSLFTSTPYAVENFLRALKSLMPQLFILDSVTHTQSCLFSRAHNNNFLSAKRQYFIDNNDQNTAQELINVYNHAKKYKEVYAIGHARQKTLNALKNWDAVQDKNFIFKLPPY